MEKKKKKEKNLEILSCLPTLDSGAHREHARPAGGRVSGWGAGTWGLSFRRYSDDALVCW